MLAVLMGLGHSDDVGRHHEDESGGKEIRFCFLPFRNQIPNFLIFSSQILMAGKKKSQEESTYTFLDGKQGANATFPLGNAPSWRWEGVHMEAFQGHHAESTEWMLLAVVPGAWSSPSINAADFSYSWLTLEDVFKEKATAHKIQHLVRLKAGW